MTSKQKVSVRQLERYPIYLKYLISMRNTGITVISSPVIAKAMKCSEEQVRKDFQIVATKTGKPGSGRDVNQMIKDLETFLGYDNVTDAVIIGTGGLGGAFMKYKGFNDFGFNIVAGFDNDKSKIDMEIEGKKIYSMDRLEDIIKLFGVKIAILTTPAPAAQKIAERLVASGIKGIWNFAPVHLELPDDIIVERVELASSLAILSHRLNKQEQEISQKDE